MKSLSYYGKKLQHLCSALCSNLVCYVRATCFLISCFYKFTILRVHKFFVQLFYFIFISLFGFWILSILKPKSTNGHLNPTNLDLYFTSVSAVTVSSMSTVEMEVFSNSQLILITFLMLIGGEVFTSMVGLHLIRPKFKPWRKDSKIESVLSSTASSPRNSNFSDDIELDIVVLPDSPKPDLEKNEIQDDLRSSSDIQTLKYPSLKFLGVVALVYFLVMHILGISSVLVYLACVSSAKDVLRHKGLKTSTFVMFTVVSTFSSCGFIPTNENMGAFKQNSGLLLIIIPLILFGNTLYPACLRVSVWFLGKIFKKREANFLLKHSREIGHLHLFPGLHSRLLVVTVFGFISLQLFLFCTYEWNSSAMDGLNSSYQKVVGSFFQVVNTRHAGESVVDIAAVDPAVLVVLMAMMYLPPYTSFLPVKGDEESREEPLEKKKERGKVAENIIFSQLSYVVIFIILICITERKRLKEDPLNFSVFNIAFEVISAYGNVGFSTGYSCDRLINPDPACKNKSYGFAGRWSDEGKMVLIIVMIFGRLKRFNMEWGKAWKLM
ncbi:sodium transporter HKT1-like [Lycium barbarum]|uniref:HKT1 n=1 Tax=Lycium barbarum TaxID=112863 RepID=A0A385HD17_LYCBA|nr:sodium transporter HKT1-like [Lycium barbarum]AXY40149.1 HKT1 [Lycium barbarum]